MALDFSSYLNVPVEDIKAPLPLPIGHYFADIVKWGTGEAAYDGPGGPKTPIVAVTFKITGADSDVDTDSLPEGGGVGRIVERPYTLNDPDASGQSMLRVLGEKTCALDVKGLDLVDLLNQLPGQPVKLYIEQRQGKDDRIFPKVAKVLSVHA